MLEFVLGWSRASFSRLWNEYYLWLFPWSFSAFKAACRSTVHAWRSRNCGSQSHLLRFSNRLDIKESLDPGLWVPKTCPELLIKTFSTIHRLSCFSDSFPGERSMTFTDRYLLFSISSSFRPCLLFTNTFLREAWISMIFRPGSKLPGLGTSNVTNEINSQIPPDSTHSKYGLNSNTFSYWLIFPRFFPNSIRDQ